jgi:RND family efflux transporter MFP subunit
MTIRLTPRRLGAAAIALGGLVVAAAVAPGRNDAPAPEPPRPVKAMTVRAGEQASRATFPGTVQPRHQSALAFRVAGRVTKRLVDVGAPVAPGTVLATLDREDFDLGLRSAQAQLAAAQADLVQAERDRARYEEIRNSPAFSQATYDKRLSAATMAKARVRDAEAQVQLRQNQLGYATLVADQPGVVTAVRAEAGQVVAAGEAVFTVARSGDLEIAVSVPENRVAGLKDSRVQVGLWTRPGTLLPAHLREVGASADPVTRTYDVRYVLDEMPPDLQLGMSANVFLERPGTAAVVELPLTAIFQTGATPAVWVLAANGTLAKRPVTVAAFRSETALVAAGLHDGETVVTAGVHRLDEGQRVRVLGADGA